MPPRRTSSVAGRIERRITDAPASVIPRPPRPESFFSDLKREKSREEGRRKRKGRTVKGGAGGGGTLVNACGPCPASRCRGRLRFLAAPRPPPFLTP